MVLGRAEYFSRDSSEKMTGGRHFWNEKSHIEKVFASFEIAIERGKRAKVIRRLSIKIRREIVAKGYVNHAFELRRAKVIAEMLCDKEITGQR